ncbi:MAG: hypothetical protein K0U37_04790 [Gammaproteobacteria bacterium]|nr:hypothetical protein [Gammaproteobacteria bacterium]
MNPKEQDSAFAKATLSAAAQSEACRAALTKSATTVCEVVITPIYNKLKGQEPLSAEETQALEYLMTEHSMEKRQWGGLMVDTPKQDIFNSHEKQLELLEKFSQQLSAENIQAIHDIDAIAGVTKAIADASFCYVEALKSLHSPQFDTIKGTIFPTPEELAIRIIRTETGEEPHLATSYGIGQEHGQDIAPKNNPPENAVRKHESGKSYFLTADTQIRAQLITEAYDAAVEERVFAEADVAAEAPPSAALLQALETTKKVEDNFSQKMIFYHIPLNKEERNPNLMTHQPPKPAIQRLAEWGGSEDQALPLVASASGTSARAFITLQDLGAFSEENQLDNDTVQYMGAALCGTIVHGGHHSVIEVGEVYNRTLDYNAIQALENGDLPVEADATIGSVEESMSYYHIGDSASFLPKDIRQAVTTQEPQQETLQQEALLEKKATQQSMKEQMQTIRKEHLKIDSPEENNNPNLSSSSPQRGR